MCPWWDPELQVRLEGSARKQFLLGTEVAQIRTGCGGRIRERRVDLGLLFESWLDVKDEGEGDSHG